MKEWVQSISENSDKNVKFILVGNKIDLKREVSKDEGKNMAKQYGISYHETSAKDNIGIDEAINDLVTQVVNSKNEKKENLVLDNEDDKKNTGGCKC